MISELTKREVRAAVDVLVAADKIEPENKDVIIAMFDIYFSSNYDDRHRCFLDYEGEEMVGVGYIYPEAASPRVWKISILAYPDGPQQVEFGQRMIAHMEKYLADADQRLLLVEVSSIEKYAGIRSFYESAGFTEEARIRDYYKAGNDMVIYRKEIVAEF